MTNEEKKELLLKAVASNTHTQLGIDGSINCIYGKDYKSSSVDNILVHSGSIEVYESELKHIEISDDGLITDTSNEYSFRFVKIEPVTIVGVEALDNIAEKKYSESIISTGSKTNYYNVPPNKDGYVDVDKISEYLNLHAFEFNIIKAIFGIAIARKTGNARHGGTSISRDLEKMKHYSNKLYSMLTNNKDK